MSKSGWRRVVLAVLAAAVALVGLAQSGTAEAASVSCGQTLVANATFKANVGPCEDGLVIGADDIVVDLAGKSLLGSGRPEVDQPGIDTNGHSHVVIRNGTVRGFSAGVAINEGSANTVSDMRIRDNLGSLDDSGNYGDGIVLFASHNNRITGNRVIHNGTYNGIGIVSGDDNLIDNNVVQNNDVAQTLATPRVHQAMRDVGIWILSLAPGLDAERNTVRGNQVIGNGADGIRVARFAFDTAVRSNSVSGNGTTRVPAFFDFLGDGIAVRGDRSLVSGNSVARNGANGIGAYEGSGVIGPTGTRNTITRNTSRANNLGVDPSPAYDLYDDHLQPPCDANAWSANNFGTFNQPCVTGA